VNNEIVQQLPLFSNEPETIIIQLTRGQITVIDNIDKDLTQYKWYAALRKSTGTNYYAVKRSIWIPGSKQNGPRILVYMARVILERILGRKLLKGEMVDHKDNNPLNNRRENLRLSGYGSNNRNTKRYVNNKSGYKGVCWDAKSKKWRAYVNFEKKRTNLGVFDTIEDAHAAYCAKARELHGEFFNPG
jgi:hypothetical protein